MSFGSVEMATALNQTDITDLLDTYKTEAAVFDNVLVPQKFTDDASINFYLSSSEGETEVEIYNYIINCRHKTMAESRAIASMVIDTINRVSTTDYFITCEIQGSISPQDDTDNFNTPVAARIKLK